MLEKELSLRGKVAVVTGASRGIGKAIADLFYKQGCEVIRTATRVSAETSRHDPHCWPLDFTDEKSVTAFCARLKTLKRVDILVNNAGMNKIESIDKIKRDDWEKILQVNLTGSMLMMKAVSNIMIQKRIEGRIVNVSSIYGVISRRMRNAYSASKAGLIGLTRASALDLAEHQILVNALCPGFVLTDMTRSILKPSELKKLKTQIPLTRFGTEEEIAKVAVFLCSSLNTYITGQTIVADGGITIQ